VGKRGNNEGSVYFDASVGRYRAAVSLPSGRRRTVSGRTRAECASKLTQLQARLSAGLPIESSDQLSIFLDWWISSLEARAATETRSVNTVDNARWAVEKWIKPYVGGHRLRDLEPEHVEMLLAAMAAAGKSRRTVARVKSYLGQALAAAERRGKVSRNVARLAEMPVTKPPVERQSLDHDQARTILEAASGHRLEALFVCALMLGLRPGELTGLRWADVDLEGGTLQVAASMKRERGQLRLGDPKTARSRRTLRLPAPVLEALHVHDLRQALEQKEAGAAWIGSDLVFTTEVGTGLDPSNLRRLTRALTKRAGVPDVSPNELGRHSAASLLYDAGVSLEEIADVLGHTSTRMLEQHYRHRVRASMSAHVAPMEAIFGPH
jgi:integrase